MPFPEWLPQYELCFPIISEHFGPARLRIIPTGYEKDTNGNLAPAHRNCIYGLYLTARYEEEKRRLQYDICDFVEPESLQELETVLTEPTNSENEMQLLGLDGYLDLRFQQKRDGGLKIVCHSPSPGWSVNCLRLQLVCEVDSKALFDIRNQLEKLRALVSKINSGDNESSRG
ncbi:hypothetical protein Pan241w_06660 [Gimesia alba]|uniref:Uncharacterized protein n=1 Tax=Gimesia alba TaxID=2527973 RepID=A0A517R9S2_9PLAN|nr:hypothetical protein [Gimesia alba]QDT40608.1 hypothetical protein Pan241w_06660 [Gimesia alba]